MSTQFLVPLMLLFFLSNALIAQEMQSVKLPYQLYKIQLGVFKKPSVNKLKALESLGTIQYQKMKNGLQRVYLGDFKNKELAQKVLPKIQEKGFADAYVFKKVMVVDIPKSVVIDTSYVITFKDAQFLDAQLKELSNMGNLFFQQTAKKANLLMGKFKKRADAEIVNIKLHKKGYTNTRIEAYYFSFLGESRDQ